MFISHHYNVLLATCAYILIVVQFIERWLISFFSIFECFERMFGIFIKLILKMYNLLWCSMCSEVS